jgi:hypothetical protein
MTRVSPPVTTHPLRHIAVVIVLKADVPRRSDCVGLAGVIVDIASHIGLAGDVADCIVAMVLAVSQGTAPGDRSETVEFVVCMGMGKVMKRADSLVSRKRTFGRSSVLGAGTISRIISVSPDTRRV